MGTDTKFVRAGREREQQILAFVKEYIAEHGWAPSILEVAAGVGLLSKSTAHLHVKRLVAAGKLASGGGARQLVVKE